LVDLNRVSGYRPGDTARFKCIRGYRLVGPTLLRCQQSQDRTNPKANWDTDPPHCLEILCLAPPAVEHARLVNSSSIVVGGGVNVTTPVDGYVTYECETGYRMISASSRVTCGESGFWHTDRPRCALIECRQPESIANGSVTTTNSMPPILPGTKAVYRCDVGFVISGQSEIECVGDGKWVGTVPRCLPVACRPIGDVAHGTVSGREFTFGGRIHFSCDAGYVIDGPSDAVTCTETGDWKPSQTPTCTLRPCPTPPPVEHGLAIVDKVHQTLSPVFGDSVNYACDAGYQLVGSSSRKCIENGTWSPDAPSCTKVTCRPPTAVDHATIVGGTRKSANTSDDGLQLYVPGSVIRYRCATGFAINGKETRSCRSDGSWTGPMPKCVAVNCTAPASIANGWFVAVESTSIFEWATSMSGTTIEYQCEDGYQLTGGSNRRSCTDGRYWTGTAPSCVPMSSGVPSAQCPDPEQVERVTIVGNDYSIASTIRYQCDPGYGFALGGDETSGMTSELTRTCLANRTWNGDKPECRPIKCERPPTVVPNGRLIGSNFSYDATITYECDDGYETAEGVVSTRVCKSDGRWNGPVPQCERVTCPSPAQPPNGDIRSNGTEYRFGDRVTYVCRPGYHLEGPESLECQANRTWSDEVPRCVVVECQRPPDPVHGRVLVLGGTFYGSVVRYECNGGYSLEGPENRQCEMNGQWTGSQAPRCTKIICGKPPRIEYGAPINDQVNRRSFARKNLDKHKSIDACSAIEVHCSGAR
jgi:hypothetical protein